VASSLPKISIVTPSLNQGHFIESTIRSIINQEYPNFEYIVIDGGSTDRTIDILQKYDQRIHFWTSGPDKGQANAINQGFARAHGDILAWLNSDDTYEEGVLEQVANLFDQQPEMDVISGRCRLWYGDDRDRLLDPSPLRTFEDFLKVGSSWMDSRLIVQPEAFFRRTALEKVGSLREDLKICFDACLWIEMAKAGCRFQSIDQHWANLRMHAGQLTSDLNKGYAELVRAAWQYLLADWETLGPHAPEIADDLFQALLRVQEQDRTSLEALRNSTSYRLGRLVTRLKIW
jgi:glycosyltransferase involved in cell wall biosynthesis